MRDHCTIAPQSDWDDCSLDLVYESCVFGYDIFFFGTIELVSKNEVSVRYDAPNCTHLYSIPLQLSSFLHHLTGGESTGRKMLKVILASQVLCFKKSKRFRFWMLCQFPAWPVR